MTLDTIEQRVTRVVAGLARMPDSELSLSGWATDYGIDSLGLLVLRETLERSLQVHIPDETWAGFDSLRDIVDHTAESLGVSDHASALRAASGGRQREPLTSGMHLSGAGLLHDVVEIGMPMTGLNNLAESPLLKYLGHLRWTHLRALCGVPSRNLVDAEGDRLYPTFFFVDVQFPERRHMACYRENDLVMAICTLERFGASMLDGVAYLLPAGTALGGQLPFEGPAAAVAAGVPAVQLSNIFVKQFGGAEWLKKGRLANAGLERVPELAVPPNSYAAVKEAERTGRFQEPGGRFVPMTTSPMTVEYQLVPDRDLNGAGLVYFANYPLFLDICERQALKSCFFALPDALLDRRSLVRRRSAYLNNASSRDTLVVEVEPWIENPNILGTSSAEAAPVRLFINSRMRRRSDGRLMMVSTAEKVISGCALDDLPFFDELMAGTSYAHGFGLMAHEKPLPEP